MEPTAEEKYLHWERQHQRDNARVRQERREWMKNFALVFSVAALTVTVSTLLAR
jgi:hypothetical protein